MGGGGNAFWPIKNLVGFISYLVVFCFFFYEHFVKEKDNQFFAEKGG